ILKGAQTIISLPDGRSYICPTGNPGMASGGMGDVLTGIIAGFCAQGFSPENASLAGVFLHGMCADILSKNIGGFGFVATDMIQMIPKTINQCLL
ncbi:MAG: NAD(P)H-hydrate dehydratase, partial [Desulfobacula sp.]|nr:NAD(P)H-hydrate dehydratase [Desulfobacula sp.]